MPDVIIPVEGGKQVVLSEAAQAAGKAAVEWAVQNPELSNSLRGGSKNKLDAKTQKNLNEFEQSMRSNPPKPATIVNLHPFPLTFGTTSRFLRGITVPACNPGQPFAFFHIRGYRRDWYYEEDGSRKFSAILPIQLASEFVREFSNKDNYGGGVIIYEGDSNPEKLMDKEIEVYDPIGRVITKDKPGVEYDEENNPFPTTIKTPVLKRLSLIVQEERVKRNEVYLRRVRKADHDYRLPGGKGVWMITSVHELMADVLYADGVIAEKPAWDLSTRAEMGLSENNCPACGVEIRKEAFKCGSCGHILSAFRAYEAGAIEYGHVSMETMTSDEWEEAEEIKAKRELARKEAAERRKGGVKPKPKAEAKADTKPAAKPAKAADEPIRPAKPEPEENDQQG